MLERHFNSIKKGIKIWAKQWDTIPGILCFVMLFLRSRVLRTCRYTYKMYEPERFVSVCASAQSDQGLPLTHVHDFLLGI